MKFKTKLYLGFGFLLILFIVLLAILMNMMNQLNQHSHIVKERYEMVRQSTIIRYELMKIGRNIRDLAADPPDVQRQKLLDEWEQSRLDAVMALASLEKLDSSSKTQGLVIQLKRQYDSLNEKGERIYQYIKAQKAELKPIEYSEVTRLLKDTRLVSDPLFKTMDELQRVQEQAMGKVLNQSRETYQLAVKMIYAYVGGTLLIAMGMIIWMIRSITGNIDRVTSVMTSVTYRETDLLPRIEITSKDEMGAIAEAFNGMAQSLEDHARQEKELKEAEQEQSWLKTKIAEIATMYAGVEDLQTLAHLLMTKITPMVGASYGVFYLRDGQGNPQRLHKLAAYADPHQDIGFDGFCLGEGLVGQCASENRMILLANVPGDYIQIISGTGMASPASIMILPAEFEGEVLAVVELASFERFTPIHQLLLHEVMSNIGISINSILSRMQVEKLLQESQTLTEELQSQSEELQMQQEELRTINEKLEEQYEDLEQKTRELEKTRGILEEKALQLALSSQYKSEFLANMSHELRTPLNSMLILSQMLAENADGNLTEKQVEYVHTIYSSGHDLLHLINDILDLSKVESGKMEVIPKEVSLSDIQAFVEAQFSPVAQQKGIPFTVQLAPGLPKTIYTDEHRLQQVLKNLLSNAFKFTEQGHVSLHIQKADKEALENPRVCYQNEWGLAFSVTDTGIGIPKEKQSMIFEAFKQADGTTARNYGGTGLGLSISREISRLLGGFIEIDSMECKGSTFTLYLPYYNRSRKIKSYISSEAEAAAGLFGMAENIQDVPLKTASNSNVTWSQKQQGEALLEGKKILIVDDDIRNVFALTAALEGYQTEVLFAENGREGIKLLRENPDTDLILMDMMMPEMDGFEAMHMIRQMPEFQSIPIIAVTAKAMNHDREQCLEGGASGYISKPVNLEQLCSLMQAWLY